MTEQEKQLVEKISNFIIIKAMDSKTNEVNYGSIARFMNVPVEIIKTAAVKICQCLINNANVEDIDILDDCAFDVMLKRRIA
jgi:hypothetical protein